MRRRWTSFDHAATNQELASLPPADQKALKIAMKEYRMQVQKGWRVENYGDGLLMITDSGQGQGRCLFFQEVANGEDEVLLIALTFYKKEGRKAPKSIIDRARSRMKR